MSNIKSTLGKLYYYYTDIPNGFYSLNLVEFQDQKILDLLIKQEKESTKKRKESKMGDISQNGNWSSFRNICLDGEKMEKIDESKLPEKGRLEFDYIRTDYKAEIKDEDKS
jgi:hypothetical protein